MSMKNPVTPAGIEPASFRFVAKHLNHCATAVPKPIPKNEIFPDDVNFAYTKNGWMTADFMEEWRGRGTFWERRSAAPRNT